MIIIALTVLGINFTTRQALAEDLSNETLIAQLVSRGVDDIIVETADDEYDFFGDTEFTQNQGLISALSAIPVTGDPLAENPSATVSGGSAVVKPNLAQTTQSGTPRASTQTYIVQDADTIGSISSKFGISINTILWANNLSPRSIIRPGDKLSILPVDGIQHKVARNETLSSIARRYNVSSTQIQEFNRLADASLLRVNQTLIIPGGKARAITSRSSSGTTRTIAAPAGTDAAPSSSGLVWPVNCHRINQYYHLRHSGLDIDNCRAQDPIFAAAAGRVEIAGWSSRGYGLYTIIDHGNGMKTLYAHFSQLYVTRGQQVSQGQTIGIMGTTGRSTGIHLHYEVRVGGRTQNPFNYY